MATPKKTPFIARTFIAIDEDGTRHALRLWKLKIEVPMLSGEPSVTTSEWKIDSTEGRHVNHIDGELTFADTGERLTAE